MALKRRWVEVHRLTISGLEQGTGYGSFVRNTRSEIETLADAVRDQGGKSHALYEAKVINSRLRLRFLSFTTGYRPDILDTEAYSVEPNPLDDTQTGVEWTHALGGRVNGRYLLLCEKVQSGIWPSGIEHYLQWMIDKVHGQEWIGEEEDDEENITVSMEPEPGAAFVQRINDLSRVRVATVRTVRPNPGWKDLETELAGEADDSKAQKADVTMVARRDASLAKNKGIVQAIKSMFKSKELDYAAIEGERDGQKDHFTTKNLVERRRLSLRLDEGGQVDHSDASRRALDRHEHRLWIRADDSDLLHPGGGRMVSGSPCESRRRKACGLARLDGDVPISARRVDRTSVARKGLLHGGNHPSGRLACCSCFPCILLQLSDHQPRTYCPVGVSQAVRIEGRSSRCIES